MENSRQFWIDVMLRISDPVLDSLSKGRLRSDMPLKHHPDSHDRADYTYLEALGRTLMGVAPWLETPAADPAEERLRALHAELARKAIAMSVDTASPDCMNFENGYQPIVDAAFLAQALLRAPKELWGKLDDQTRANLIAKLKHTRTRKPWANNWLLFSGIIEAFLYTAGESDWDQMRVDYALKQHMQWYVGDGMYGDGPEFHWDYYNSFVIQPMLVDILRTVSDVNPDWAQIKDAVMRRAARYATVLEHLIARDGTYPVIGRSSCYRFGAFQSLAHAALLHNLERKISPAQVRCALTEVIRRVTECPGMFDEGGWLNIGVCGEQPAMGETYISIGSLYLCCAVFLPLGLPASDPFWSAPDAQWTAQRMWGGENLPCEHALS